MELLAKAINYKVIIHASLTKNKANHKYKLTCPVCVRLITYFTFPLYIIFSIYAFSKVYIFS